MLVGGDVNTYTTALLEAITSRGAFPIVRAPESPTPTPVPTPQPQLDLLDVAAKVGSLGIPEPVLAKLTNDERTFLVLLKENGSLKTSEVVGRMKKTAPRVNGLVVQLRRKLHMGGIELFTIETLPNGETLYRFHS